MTVTSSASGMSKGGIISKDADSFDQFTGTFNVERLAKKSKEYGSRAHRWITGGANAKGVIDPNQIKAKESNAWIYKQAGACIPLRAPTTPECQSPVGVTYTMPTCICV